MNVLFCGDRKIIDGLTIAVLSLLKQVSKPLTVYVFTMDFEAAGKKFHKISESDLSGLAKKMRQKNPKNELIVLDISGLYKKDPVTANKHSYFTPYCMLRLYADQIPGFPEKILYLDTDVVCLNDPAELYEMNNSRYEMVGVLDRYGGKIFRRPFGKQKYINSGVLLLNLGLIRKTGLFKKAREMCEKLPMVMPDQTALNFCVKYKKIVKKKFNDQEKIQKDTVFRHFSNTFKFFPYFKVQKIKPWNVDKLHEILKTHEFDDVLEEWRELKAKRETLHKKLGGAATEADKEVK